MDDHKVEAKEIVSASKKLGAKDAAALAKAATRVIVAKGAKVAEYEPGTWGPAAAAAVIAGEEGWHDPKPEETLPC